MPLEEDRLLEGVGAVALEGVTPMEDRIHIPFDRDIDHAVECFAEVPSTEGASILPDPEMYIYGV